MKSTILLLAGAALVVAAAVALPASHIKPGLWEVKIDTGHAMPDMSNMPPQVQAQMRAHGMQMMGGGGMTARKCITPADASAGKPAMGHSKDCRVENVKSSATAFSADMVCTGEMKGRGHVEITFESPVHYYGTTSMHGMAGGHPIDNTTKIDARFVSSDCGKVQ